jgi:hypothetical protein
MKIHISINGKNIKLSEKDNNERIAKVLSSWVIQQSTPRTRGRMLDYYRARLETTEEELDYAGAERVWTAIFKPAKIHKVDREIRIWKVRRLIAIEVINQLERSRKND